MIGSRYPLAVIGRRAVIGGLVAGSALHGTITSFNETTGQFTFQGDNNFANLAPVPGAPLYD